MSKYYYCPYCGEIKNAFYVKYEMPKQCNCCLTITPYNESLYDTDYYSEKADEARKSTNHSYITGEYILRQEEIITNPLYNQECVNKKQNKEIKQFQKTFNSNKANNQPKCPTCNSTNISKISTTSKIVGAVTFGLFSKTARSQFKCNNCGYKW